jgi:hypothetical protein
MIKIIEDVLTQSFEGTEQFGEIVEQRWRKLCPPTSVAFPRRPAR